MIAHHNRVQLAAGGIANLRRRVAPGIITAVDLAAGTIKRGRPHLALGASLATLTAAGNLDPNRGTLLWAGTMQTASASMADGDSFGLLAVRNEVFGPLYARTSGTDSQICAQDAFGNIAFVAVPGGWDAMSTYKAAVTWDLAAGTMQVAFNGVAGAVGSFKGW